MIIWDYVLKSLKVFYRDFLELARETQKEIEVVGTNLGSLERKLSLARSELGL